mgnify:CR=1 FL=1|tara:strand:- start:1802 stop:2365 length:564 start_codon:yes stop_codon:yes gene_type:complete
MNNQNLLVYESDQLHNILNELEENLNFNIVKLKKNEFSNTNFNKYNDYLILTLDKNFNKSKQILCVDTPIKLSKLLEKINLQFLKLKFSNQSNIDIGNYKININSREIISDKQKLRLTEKEVDTIIYLSNTNNPVSINELQEKVWGYQSELETHTVETHIHRLRKKIKEKFKDDNLIVSTKNGYQIN